MNKEEILNEFYKIEKELRVTTMTLTSNFNTFLLDTIEIFDDIVFIQYKGVGYGMLDIRYIKSIEVEHRIIKIEFKGVN